MSDETEKTTGRRILAWLLDRWVAIVLIVLAAFFIAQNRAVVRVYLLWGLVEMPLWVAFTLVLLVGIAVGWFARGKRAKRAKRAKRGR